MKRNQLLQGVGAFLGMLLLILDAKTALLGAQTGIDLCLRTVIPSLFPFFVCSILLTSSLSGISFSALRPFGKICGIPPGAETILLSGLFGGYPVGAQCVTAAYHNKLLSRGEAERMLAFCNNVGPAFLFGMVSSLFASPWISWLLWGIHILGALLTAVVLPPNGEERISADSTVQQASIAQILRQAITAMGNVCGWVVIFRVVLAFLHRWLLWIFPVEIQTILAGILELTNGCVELGNVTDMHLRFLVVSGLLAFGGLCVTMQTISVTTGLSLRLYFLGKGIQTVFCTAVAFALAYRNCYPLGILLGMIIVKRKLQKKSSNRCSLGV